MTDSPFPYSDILLLPRPTSQRVPMPREKRAAQFMPFAALTGYEEAIDETARLTHPFAVPDEAAQAVLERRLQHLRDHPGLQVTVEYFQPDPFKEGGSYVTLTGLCKKADDILQELILAGAAPIPFCHLLSLSGPAFDEDD